MFQLITFQLYMIFKDSNVSWYTNDPDLTECFQKTVLIWTPCFLLWIFSVFNLVVVKNDKNRNGMTSLFITKAVFTAALVFLSLLDLIWDVVHNEMVYPVNYCTSSIKLITFVSSLRIIFASPLKNPATFYFYI